MQKNLITQNALVGILKQSPMLLLISMILSFILVALVQVFYYSNFVFIDKVGTAGIAYAIAVGIALITQLARVAFGVSGAYDFATGKTGKGIIGILFSLALAVFESFELAEVARVWSDGDPTLYFSSIMILQFLDWIGFGLEIRLALTVAKKAKEQQASVSSTQENTDAGQRPPLGVQTTKRNVAQMSEQDRKLFNSIIERNPNLFSIGLESKNGSENGTLTALKKE